MQSHPISGMHLEHRNHVQSVACTWSIAFEDHVARLCDSNTSFITTICWRTCGEEGGRAVVSVCMQGRAIRTLCGRHRGRTKAL